MCFYMYGVCGYCHFEYCIAVHTLVLLDSNCGLHIVILNLHFSSKCKFNHLLKIVEVLFFFCFFFYKQTQYTKLFFFLLSKKDAVATFS